MSAAELEAALQRLVRALASPPLPVARLPWPLPPPQPQPQPQPGYGASLRCTMLMDERRNAATATIAAAACQRDVVVPLFHGVESSIQSITCRK